MKINLFNLPRQRFWITLTICSFLSLVWINPAITQEQVVRSLTLIGQAEERIPTRQTQLFLKFENSSKREAFLKELREKRPDIEAQARASKSQPGIVTFHALTPEQAEALTKFIGKAKVYEDIHFETLPR